MNDEVFLKLQQIIREVFRKKNLEIKMETSANDISGWDSLKHVQIIYEVETAFGIKFRLSEMVEMQTIGDIYQAIKTKKAVDDGK